MICSARLLLVTFCLCPPLWLARQLHHYFCIWFQWIQLLQAQKKQNPCDCSQGLAAESGLSADFNRLSWCGWLSSLWKPARWWCRWKPLCRQDTPWLICYGFEQQAFHSWRTFQSNGVFRGFSLAMFTYLCKQAVMKDWQFQPIFACLDWNFVFN